MTINAKNVKPTAAAIQNAVGEKSKVVTVYTIPYSVFQGDDSVAVAGLSETCKGAVTLACLIVAGMVKVTAKGRVTKVKGHSNIFRANSPAGFKKFRTGGNHKHAVLLDADGTLDGKDQYQLNSDGVKFVTSRNLKEGPAFNTEAKHAVTIAKQLKKGEPVFVPEIMTKAVKPTKCKPVRIRA